MEDKDIYRQLGTIEGKIDASAKQLTALTQVVSEDRKEGLSGRDKLEERVSKIEKDQIRQTTVSVTIAAIVSALFVLINSLIDWGAKIIK